MGNTVGINLQPVSNQTPGILNRIPAGGRVLVSNAQGSAAEWTDPTSGLQLPALFATPNTPIVAQAVTPGWLVCGAFKVVNTGPYGLKMLGSVSDASLTLNCRIYCVTFGHEGIVANANASLIAAVIDAEAENSLPFTLTGNLQYQVQAEVVGNSGDDYFGFARQITIYGAG